MSERTYIPEEKREYEKMYEATTAGEGESRMTKPYHLSVIKKHGTKTDAELAELKAKYKDGVPSEIIDHVAEKLARVWTSDDDKEARIAE